MNTMYVACIEAFRIPWTDIIIENRETFEVVNQAFSANTIAIRHSSEHIYIVRKDKFTETQEYYP